MRQPNYFIAVPLPDAVKRELKERSAKLRAAYDYRRWVHGQDYHITLKFLGPCAPQQLTEVRRALPAAVRGAAPFTLQLGGVGCFGRSDAPRILWAGVRGDLDVLRRLQAAAEAAVSPLGFPPEDRPYSPHVTLARQYQGAPVPFGEQAEAWGADWTCEPWTADSAVLYRTDFGQSPMYAVVDEVRFGAQFR